MNCPNPKTQSLVGSHCFWDQSLFDCFHDFSAHTETSGSGVFRVAAADASHHTTTTSHGRRSHAPADYLRDFSEGIHDDEYDDEGYGGHAALQYEDVEDAGPPSRPQEFPTPFVHKGIRTTVCAMDHRTCQLREVKNVLMAASNVADASSSPLNHQRRHPYESFLPVEELAYLMKKKISKSKYGSNYLAVVLKRREQSGRSSSFENEKKQPEDEWDAEWVSTDEFVVVTVSPWSSAMMTHRSSLGRKREGIVHAIAVQQHVGTYHPHVLGLLNAFQDEEHLYTITKFHGGTSLQSKIVAGRQQGTYVPPETQARTIFSQLLQGLFHLQRKGVYHSNLSLENIFVDAATNQNLVISDFGRSIRVPYNDPSNFGCIIGEAEGTTRRLLQLVSQDFQTHPSENLMYLPPEVLENEDALDGFAADIWAAGVILFVLLVGMAPFKTAHYWDAAYAEISSGNLKGLLQSLKICLSDEATSLLQNMFWRDPRDRLTLAQIMDHPWVKNERFPAPRLSSATANTSIPKSPSSNHLSSAETASSTSSYATDKTNHGKSRRSAGSRKSLAKTITNMFGGGSSSCQPGKSHLNNNTSIAKVFGGLMSSSSRSNGGSSHRTRRTSLGGLSSAASSATSGSPSSHKCLAEEDSGTPFNLQLLEIPAL